MALEGGATVAGPGRSCPGRTAGVHALLASALFLALGLLPAGAREPAPQRVVSLNLCADELLLRLLPKARIASVTFLAADRGASTVADLVDGIPLNRGLAEEVVPLAPDLVLTGTYTTRAAAAMLARLGAPVLELGMPNTIAEVYAQIRALADRLGVPERGEAMVAEIAAGLDAAPPPPIVRSAVVLRPNGFTAGAGSLPDALMRRAGLDNIAGHVPTDRLGQLSVEDIVTAAPQIMIVDMDADSPPSLARSLIQHPALQHAAAHGVIVPLPSKLWSCAGPQLVEAFRRLSEAARRLDAPALTGSVRGHAPGLRPAPAPQP